MFDEGLYKAKATSWSWTDTTNGNDQFRMAFDVIGAVAKSNPQGTPAPCEPGSGSWSITVTSEANAEWLISTVQHLGYDRDDLLALDPDQPGAFNFEGVEFIVQCKHEEYKEEMREKWTVYKPAKLSKDRLVALNARYGHLVKELKERRGAKATTDKADPDIPF